MISKKSFKLGKHSLNHSHTGCVWNSCRPSKRLYVPWGKWFRIRVFSCWVFSNIQSLRTWTLRSGCPKMCPYIKRSWATSSQDCKENAQISNLWDDWCLQGTESSQFRILYIFYNILYITAFVFKDPFYFCFVTFVYICWLRGFSSISGVELPVPDYGKLEEVINQVLEEMGCQRVKHSVAKCISIYETWMTWMSFSDGWWFSTLSMGIFF